MTSKNLTTIKLTASDNDVIKYLHILWSKNEPQYVPVKPEPKKALETDTTTQPIKKSVFKKHLRNSLSQLREIGFDAYEHLKLEDDMSTPDIMDESYNIVSLTKKNISDIYKYNLANQLKKEDLLKNFSICRIFTKYKSGDTSSPNSFRYMVAHHNVIKIIDRLWIINLINKCGDNVPNPDIFKSNFGKQKIEQCVDVGIKNTMDYDNVVLLDIQKAFDSVDWDVMEELLISNLTKKINYDEAIKLVREYMIIIRNRKLLYNNKCIKYYKGIPTGLPSSMKVFTLIIEEIIERWLCDNHGLYFINRDFILNVYVDDIYIKFLKPEIASDLLKSFITNIEKYMFTINKAKSKVDPKLSLIEFPNKLTVGDFYLGIPFTRDIKLYDTILLEEYQTRHDHKLTWMQIYFKLVANDDELYGFNKTRQSILGYLRYKLKPILNIPQYEPITFDKIINFIKINFIFPSLEL